jgi:hypothetical protein
VRRRRNHGSGDARHDGAGQRNGSGGNPRRVACVTTGLLNGTSSRQCRIPSVATLKPYLMVWLTACAYVCRQAAPPR